MYRNRYKKKRNRFMTGEDIEMFREKENERSKNNDKNNICDTHIDGA